MNLYVLSFGSNVPTGESEIRQAVAMLEAAGVAVVRLSSVYTTPAFGGMGPDYTNAVAEVTSDLELDGMNALVKVIEARRGRSEADRATGRVVIDVDVVISKGLIVRPKDYNREYFRRGYSEFH